MNKSIKLATGQNITLKNAPENMDEGLVLRKLQEQAPEVFQAHLSALKASNPDAYKRQINSLGKTGADASQLAKDASFGQAAMIAAGGATDALGTGVQELWAGLTGDEEGKARLQAEGAERRGIMAPLEEERPVATALGSTLPYMAVPVGAAAGAAGKGLGLLGKAAGSQALQRGGQAVGKSLLADAALGGAALGAADQDSSALGGAVGGAVGHGVGRAVGLGAPKMAEGAKKSWDWAKRNGFSLPPSEMTGGVTGKIRGLLEAGMESTPWLAIPAEYIKGKNQKALNRIASKAIGQGETNELTKGTLAKAHRDLGNKFEEIANKKTKVVLDDGTGKGKLLKELDGIQEKYTFRIAELDEKAQKALKKLRSVALGESQKYPRPGNWKAKPSTMTGEEFQRETRALASTAKSLASKQGGDRQASMALMEMVDALDDAMARSLGEESRKSWKLAKRQWRNLMQLETGQVLKSDGNVSGVALANVLRRNDPRGFRLGDNETDLYKAAEFADLFGRGIVGRSGTPERQALTNYAKSIRGGAIGGGLLGGTTGGGLPGMGIGAGIGAALGVAAPLGTGLLSAGYHAAHPGKWGVLGRPLTTNAALSAAARLGSASARE